MATGNTFATEGRGQRTPIDRLAQLCQSQNISVARLDTQSFPRYRHATVDLYREVYDTTTADAADYIDSCGRLLGFQALLLTTTADTAVAGQWSYRPATNEFCGELQAFIAAQRAAADQRDVPVVYGRNLIVHPDFQGQGFGTGLRALYRRLMHVQHPEGALLLSRILLDNHASMATARLVGHLPTGILDPTSPEPRQYWYGTTYERQHTASDGALVANAG
jgi:GNAT superfamily N-acetyltransferase